MNIATAATKANQDPRIVAGRNIARASGSPLERTIHHADTAATKVPAVRKDAATACQKAAKAVLLENSATMLSNSARPVTGLKRAPTGCCMNELAAMMKNAEKLTPSATSQIDARWASLGIRFQPKIHSPMNVDSRKKATRPSIARGAPKTSPTKREYSLQFIPNWNSWTMPVATPMAKLIRKIFPKNRVIRYQCGFPVTTQSVCITATIGASPMVSGTKMKW